MKLHSHPATILAGAYLVVAGSYIALSGRVAQWIAPSEESLAAVELAKGITFVVLTAGLLFWLAHTLYARIAAEHAEVERMRDALARAELRAVAGALAGAVAHDMNNLLTVLTVHLDLLAEKTPPANRALVDDATLAAVQLGRLASRLHETGAARSRSRQRFDLAHAVGEALPFVRRHPRVRDLTLDWVGGSGAVVWGDETLVVPMVWNLVLNAADATGGRGRVEVRVEVDDDDVLLIVHDDGPGIPEAQRELVFEPLYTTKPVGTGLAWCRSAGAPTCWAGQSGWTR
ncbi:MAG: HAMP domain-containing sensor histidine kinase, partial [Myxococcota bacterium]